MACRTDDDWFSERLRRVAILRGIWPDEQLEPTSRRRARVLGLSPAETEPEPDDD